MSWNSIFRRLVLALVVVLAVSSASAAVPPPFGSSVTWERGQEGARLEAMKGKSVLVLFFQSWCPICNGWSGQMMKQLEETYGNDPAMVLVALKTDGGSMKEAMDYLQGRTDVSKWLVGVDEGAVYHRQVTGGDALYDYLWVKPDGTIGEVDKVGRTVSQPGEKRYWIARDAQRKIFRADAGPVVKWEGEIPPDLQAAARLAERGNFPKAIAESAKLKSRPDLAAAVGAFQKQIGEILKQRLESLGVGLDDAANERRYFDYLALRDMERDFSGMPFSRSAQQAADKHKSAAWLAPEEKAKQGFEGIMRKAGRAEDEKDQERVKKALDELSAQYPETVYGKLAAAVATKK
jgi:hypothetical protein